MRNGMSYSEAGKLGALKVRDLKRKRHEDFVKSYYEKPSYCKNCGCVIEYDHRRNVFCSSTCSATYNNIHGKTGRRKYSNEDGKYINGHFHFRHICKNCGREFFSPFFHAKCCSMKCGFEHRSELAYQEVEKNGEFKASECYSSRGEAGRAFIRSYLKNRRGNKCSICGIENWMGKPITFIVDHIDGNAYNNRIDNVRLVCPNCESQLPTSKGKNRGFGRKARRITRRFTDPCTGDFQDELFKVKR